jgi:hypothetical protein
LMKRTNCFPSFLLGSTLLLSTLFSLSLTHGAEPFLRSCPLCSHSRNSQHFMEPEGSLPCSQEPSTGLFPEPDQSNPHHPPLKATAILRSLLLNAAKHICNLQWPYILY